MVKYLCIEKCEDCPHCQFDPNVTNHELWGNHVCIFFWDGKVSTEDKIRIIEDMNEIPNWCELDGPNDL